jgi:hypothetical protein
MGQVSAPDDGMREEPLAGGNTHAAVVKVGATVRRPTGPWTPSVHALLQHLELNGFAHAPRVLGLDDQGRESLTFAEGVVVHPGHDSLTASDEALSEIARIIRAYHDVVSTYPHDDTDVWGENGRDPVGPPELICHNDLGPWNLVKGPGGSWTFIDWDLAAPGRRSWDLSWALLGCVSLMPEAALADSDIRRRIAVFRDAYGAELVPVVDVIVAA